MVGRLRTKNQNVNYTFSDASSHISTEGEDSNSMPLAHSSLFGKSCSVHVINSRRTSPISLRERKPIFKHKKSRKFVPGSPASPSSLSSPVSSPARSSRKRSPSKRQLTNDKNSGFGRVCDFCGKGPENERAGALLEFQKLAAHANCLVCFFNQISFSIIVIVSLQYWLCLLIHSSLQVELVRISIAVLMMRSSDLIIVSYWRKWSVD